MTKFQVLNYEPESIVSDWSCDVLLDHLAKLLAKEFIQCMEEAIQFDEVDDQEES